MMTKIKFFEPKQYLILVLFFMIGQSIVAQDMPTTQVLPDTSKMSYNQISQGLNLFLYPTNNQSKQTQKVDEFDCYVWAMEQSGVDPLNLPKTEAAVQAGPTGGAVVGGAKGAAAGAAIGAIAGDTGKGAAIGATVGAMGGRRKGKQAQAQHNQAAQTEAASVDQAKIDNFIKAFSACIEGKGYTVK